MLVKKKDSKRRKYLKKYVNVFKKIKEKINLYKVKNIEIKIEKENKIKTIEKESISSELLIAKLLSSDELKRYGKILGRKLKTLDLDLASKISEEIVIFLVSVAYYEGFSKGGYWNKVFQILGNKYNQKEYLYLIGVLFDTLNLKKLYIAKDTKQWAYNTVVTHTIVPLEGGAFFRFLDFIYSFYTSLNSTIDGFEKEELISLIENELKSAIESYIFLKGTRLAIENCLPTVKEYYFEILKYIDILDSQKNDRSSLSESIKNEINKWYNLNTNKGYYRIVDLTKNEKESEDKIGEREEMNNIIRNIKFILQDDRIDIEIPPILLDSQINTAYIKIGEQKFYLGIRELKSGYQILSKKISKKIFDFTLVKLYINDELVKEWKNKIVFLKENGTSLSINSKDNIYELDYKRTKILFNSEYSLFSSNAKINNEVYCISGNIMFANLYLEDEIYYLKKDNEVIIIKNKLKDESPQIIFNKNMIIDNITIENKLVLNKQPKIFIPFTDTEKYKVSINEVNVKVNAGINEVMYEKSGKYEIKIFKGIKNTKDSRILRERQEYFYFKDLSIVFYNEDGDKEYLYSHRDKKQIGNYNFDSENISEVYYENKKILREGNTFDLYIDNGFKKEFKFEMTFNEIKYNAEGKMRVLEWSLDGKNYYSEYNKNILLKDIRNKKLYIKMENISEEIAFYLNNKRIINKEKNILDFSKLNSYFEENQDINFILSINFKIKGSSEKYRESLFKIRQKTEVKSINYNKEDKILDIKVRGNINELIFKIEDITQDIIYINENLDLDNEIPIELKGKYNIKIEKNDEYSFGFNDELLYEKEFIFN